MIKLKFIDWFEHIGISLHKFKSLIVELPCELLGTPLKIEIALTAPKLQAALEGLGSITLVEN